MPLLYNRLKIKTLSKRQSRIIFAILTASTLLLLLVAVGDKEDETGIAAVPVKDIMEQQHSDPEFEECDLTNDELQLVQDQISSEPDDKTSVEDPASAQSRCLPGTFDSVQPSEDRVDDQDNTDSAESVEVKNPEADQEPELAPPVDTAPIPATATPNPASIISCTDCTLAPVDKNNQLPSSYNPGGILPVASSAFTLLVSDASVNGHTIEVISAFRSFKTQKSTFNYWVGIEQGRGLSYEQAINAANKYSAKPGHSEHQLGTTYDVKCAGCASFDLVQNSSLNAYIETNAHRFGFVISYPKNSQNLTGYIYEPWHIRWIGVDLATELYNTGYVKGNGYYLTQFLISKGH